MREIIIGENDGGQRADKFLKKLCPQLPDSLLYKTFRRKDIKRNGKWIPAETMLQAGDVLRVYLPDDCFPAEKMPEIAALPPPEIVYADGQIAILRKPPNLPVHADGKGSSDTLQGRFLYYLAVKGAYDPRTEQSFTPALCNRLDRNTEGFVIGAKTAAALREMNARIRAGNVQKEYLCIVVGTPEKHADTVISYHRRLAGKKAELSPVPRDGFREIRTGYQVLESRNGLSLVQVRLYTGRTHQIRVQMAALGCPVLGDGKYGNLAANRTYGAAWQQLAACRLTFCFPPSAGLPDLAGKQFHYMPDFCAQYGFTAQMR